MSSHRRLKPRCGPILQGTLTCLLAALVCSGASSAQTPLAKFHSNLAALEVGERKTVSILQIGDSHTAADHVSGRLRTLLQKRFGNAGRGFMPPGAPHAWYRPYQVAVTQSGGWITLSSNRLKPDPAAYGLSGSIAVGKDPADVIAIDIKPEADATLIEIGLIAEPGNGALRVLADGQLLAELPSHDGDALKAFRLGLPANTRRIELRPAGDGPVKLADHSLLSNKPGVTVSNIGFIGAQVALLSRWHWPRVISQIADLDPALIILAFGTNEGHAPVATIMADYESEFESRLRALQAAAPNAAVVVVGQPDANRYPRYCLPKPLPAKPGANAGLPPLQSSPSNTSEPSGQSAPTVVAIAKPASPPSEPPSGAICKPLSVSERTNYDRLLATEDRALCRWHTPAAFPFVRRIQRTVAARHGVQFFDWFELFDGECGADQWFRRGLAHKDRVHFKQDGYWLAADRLYQRLLSGYQSPIAPPSPPNSPR